MTKISFHIWGIVSLSLTLGVLSSCTSPDATPPTVTITSPAPNSPVSGTVAVLINAVDDLGIKGVDLYVRGKGSSGRGVFINSAVGTSPFVVNWNASSNMPNQTDLELIAVAKDASGNESESPAIAVKTQNTSVPSLQLLSSYSFAADPLLKAGLKTASMDSQLPKGLKDILEEGGILPPIESSQNNSSRSTIHNPLFPSLNPTQATNDRSYLLEWLWDPYELGADGYGIYLGSKDVVGPYDLQRRQASSTTTGLQSYSKFIDEAKVGDKFYGIVTAVTSGGTTDSGYSNADVTTLLAPQAAATPSDGASIPGGRPTLTWSRNSDADGYLYFVYDKNPWDANPQLLWVNPVENGKRRALDKLTTSYPADQAALKSGTYYWWVAGVSFDATGKTDAFSFSEVRTFVVP